MHARLPLESSLDLVVVRHQVRQAALAQGLSDMMATRLAAEASEVCRACLDGGEATLVVERVHRALMLSVAGADWGRFEMAGCRAEGNSLMVDLPEDAPEIPSDQGFSLIHTLQLEERSSTHARQHAERLLDELALANERLERQRDSLTSANQNLEAVAAAVAHDLRQPLAAIQMFSTLAQQGADPAITQPQIEAAATRVGDMLDGLMELIRLREVTEESCRLSGVVERVLVDLTAMLSETGGAVSHTGDAVFAVARTHLELLVRNLVSNGLKYRHADRDPEVRISVERGTHWHHLVVADNGRGIPPEKIEKLFGMFERLERDADVRGTGVGLALVRRIVDSCGGSIEVSSSEGTKFRMRLPAGGVSAVRGRLGSKNV